MAQTRRKRQTKHRGNAAGVIEARGRTGRKPTAAEKSGDPRKVAQEKQQALDKRDRPPSWRAALMKAMFAAIAVLFIMLLAFKKSSNDAIKLFPIVLALYVPISYYSDKWVYDRRQRKKARARAEGRAAP